MSFEENYGEIFGLVQSDIEIINERIFDAVSINAPLNENIRELLSAPSKKIRLVVTLLYLRALNIEVTQRHYDLLCAVELVHNASLIHDDIIDESSVRRGKETINSKFGNKLAVIGGDYILSVVMKILVKIGSPEVLNLFAQTLEKMCVGEVNQYFDRFKVTTLEKYIEKSKFKTANLFKTSLESALILSGNDYESAVNFSLNFGIAFQIRDDLLNIISCKQNDKPFNNDVECGVYNAPVILGGGVDNIMNGVEKTYLLLNNYIVDAEKYLRDLPENQYKSALKKLTEELNNV